MGIVTVVNRPTLRTDHIVNSKIVSWRNFAMVWLCPGTLGLSKELSVNRIKYSQPQIRRRASDQLIGVRVRS